MKKIYSFFIFTCVFLYEVLAQPSITSFSPVSGLVGSTVTINGSGFNSNPADNNVCFGKIKANVVSATTNSLTVTVPAGATFQPISINVSGLVTKSSKPFLVTFGDQEPLTSGSFTNQTTFGTGTAPVHSTEGDIDGDGKIDVLTANYTSNSFSVFRNTSSTSLINSASFAAKVDFTSNNIQCIFTEDIDGDTKVDVLTLDKTNNQLNIFRNTSTSGNISFATPVTFATGAFPYFVFASDLNADGKADIVVTNFTTKTISVFQNNSIAGSISLLASFSLTTGTEPHGIIIEDLDGDNKADIAQTNYATNNIYVYKNIHSGGTLTAASFSNVTTFNTGNGPMGITAKDIDGDNLNDLIYTNQAGGTLAVARNISSSGTINFATPATFSSGTTTRSAYVSDMNGDGKPDIVCANIGSNTMSVFQNTSSSGTITFSAANTFSTGTQPHMALAIDVNGDTKPEIVSCNYSSNTISVYRNSQINTEPTTIATTVLFNNITGSSVGITWNNGNGSRHLVVARAATAVTSTPADEKTYSASSAFGTGSEIGLGNYVVYNGTGNSCTITGLTNTLTYYFTIFEYNGSDATSNFLLSSFATGNVSLTTSLKQITRDLTSYNDYLISPIPNNGTFLVYSTSSKSHPVNITIYNMTGQCVYAQLFPSEMNRSGSIEVKSKIASGVYTCVIEEGNQNRKYRLVVQ